MMQGRQQRLTIAVSPQAANARGRMGLSPRVPAARTYFIQSDPSRHSPVGVGAGVRLFGRPLLLGRADQARNHAFPSAHDTVPDVRPACRTSGTMRQSAARHTQIGEA